MIEPLVNCCIRQACHLGRWALGRKTDSTRQADQPTWDAEYTSGRWCFLHGAGEHGHYALIAGYVHRHLSLGPEGTVLDVGCGEAILFNYLWGLDPGSYLGCDLSAVAIDSASATSWPPLGCHTCRVVPTLRVRSASPRSSSTRCSTTSIGLGRWSRTWRIDSPRAGL